MSDITESYKKAYKTLARLVDTAFDISISLQGKEIDTRELEAVLRIYTKLISHSRAIMLLAPKKPAGVDAPRHELWDLSSMSVLCRSLIDSYYVLFYIAIDEVDLATKDFRWIMWDYHYYSRLLEKLKSLGSTRPEIDEIKDMVASLKDDLMNHQIYKGYDRNTQKDLRKPRNGILATNSELSVRADIDKCFYKSTFMNLSSYVHSHPFSIEQLTHFRANTESSLRLLKVPLDYSSIYLSLALRDFVKLVPEADDHIDEDTQIDIDLFCGIAKTMTKF
jgi:hypothetical protein